MRDALNLHIRLHGQLLDRHARPALPQTHTQLSISHSCKSHTKKPSGTHRLRVLPKGIIDPVHGREVGHVRQEDVDLDHVLQRRAGLFQDRG